MRRRRSAYHHRGPVVMAACGVHNSPPYQVQYQASEIRPTRFNHNVSSRALSPLLKASLRVVPRVRRRPTCVFVYVTLGRERSIANCFCVLHCELSVLRTRYQVYIAIYAIVGVLEGLRPSALRLIRRTSMLHNPRPPSSSQGKERGTFKTRSTLSSVCTAAIYFVVLGNHRPCRANFAAIHYYPAEQPRLVPTLSRTRRQS